MDEEEEIDPSTLSMDDKVALLMEELPVPVQRFVQSPERNQVSIRLSQKYRLHADAAGAFERAYLFMLLGIYSPEEFVQELRNAGIDEPTISGLAADVNEQVFKRLREEERSSSEPAARVPQPPAVPVMSIGQPENPPPVTAPPPAAAPYAEPVAPPQRDPFVQASANPVVESPAIPAPVPPSAQNYAPAPLPPARTMASDMEMLAQGIQGSPVSPARSFQTASVPITRSIPPAYAQAIPQQTEYASSQAMPPPVQAPQPTIHAVPYASPPLRGPDGDPYREPIQ